MRGGHAARLRIHDVNQVQTACGHDHDQETEADGNLVAHHLGRRAQRTEEGVFRVGRPARDDHAVHLDRGDGQNHQQTGVHVGQHGFGAEGHGHPGGQRRHDGHDGPEPEQTVARSARADQLLGEQLERIGDRLQQTKGPYAVGSVTNLDPAQQLALPEREVGHCAHQGGQHGHDLDQVPDHGPSRGGPPRRGDQTKPAVVHRVDHACTSSAIRLARASAVSCRAGARRTRPSSW